MQFPYDHRNCQSLFGYAAEVHRRSGGVCQLCGASNGEVNFDFWRQLTVEHLIGSSQGGYLAQIRAALREKLGTLPEFELERVAQRIDAANTISACSFCNSTPSRSRAPVGMAELINEAPDDVEAMLAKIAAQLEVVLAAKRAEVSWKLESVRKAFEEGVAPHFQAAWCAS